MGPMEESPGYLSRMESYSKVGARRVYSKLDLPGQSSQEEPGRGRRREKPPPLPPSTRAPYSKDKQPIRVPLPLSHLPDVEPQEGGRDSSPSHVRRTSSEPVEKSPPSMYSGHVIAKSASTNDSEGVRWRSLLRPPRLDASLNSSGYTQESAYIANGQLLGQDELLFLQGAGLPPLAEKWTGKPMGLGPDRAEEWNSHMQSPPNPQWNGNMQASPYPNLPQAGVQEKDEEWPGKPGFGSASAGPWNGHIQGPRYPNLPQAGAQEEEEECWGYTEDVPFHRAQTLGGPPGQSYVEHYADFQPDLAYSAAAYKRPTCKENSQGPPPPYREHSHGPIPPHAEQTRRQPLPLYEDQRPPRPSQVPSLASHKQTGGYMEGYSFGERSPRQTIGHGMSLESREMAEFKGEARGAGLQRTPVQTVSSGYMPPLRSATVHSKLPPRPDGTSHPRQAAYISSHSLPRSSSRYAGSVTSTSSGAQDARRATGTRCSVTCHAWDCNHSNSPAMIAPVDSGTYGSPSRGAGTLHAFPSSGAWGREQSSSPSSSSPIGTYPRHLPGTHMSRSLGAGTLGSSPLGAGSSGIRPHLDAFSYRSSSLGGSDQEGFAKCYDSSKACAGKMFPQSNSDSGIQRVASRTMWIEGVPGAGTSVINSALCEGMRAKERQGLEHLGYTTADVQQLQQDPVHLGDSGRRVLIRRTSNGSQDRAVSGPKKKTIAGHSLPGRPAQRGDQRPSAQVLHLGAFEESEMPREAILVQGGAGALKGYSASMRLSGRGGLRSVSGKGKGGRSVSFKEGPGEVFYRSDEAVSEEDEEGKEASPPEGDGEGEEEGRGEGGSATVLGSGAGISPVGQEPDEDASDVGETDGSPSGAEGQWVDGEGKEALENASEPGPLFLEYMSEQEEQDRRGAGADDGQFGSEDGSTQNPDTENTGGSFREQSIGQDSGCFLVENTLEGGTSRDVPGESDAFQRSSKPGTLHKSSRRQQEVKSRKVRSPKGHRQKSASDEKEWALVGEALKNHDILHDGVLLASETPSTWLHSSPDSKRLPKAKSGRRSKDASPMKPRTPNKCDSLNGGQLEGKRKPTLWASMFKGGSFGEHDSP